jgi:hypothetical protein
MHMPLTFTANYTSRLRLAALVSLSLSFARSLARLLSISPNLLQHSGVAFNSNWWEPLSDAEEDRVCADRALAFQLGWFADPLYLGDYPQILKGFAIIALLPRSCSHFLPYVNRCAW